VGRSDHAALLVGFASGASFLKCWLRSLNRGSLIAVPGGEEHIGACTCCGRPTYSGAGELTSSTGELADYWYRWSEGHQGRFTLAIAFRNEFGEEIENGGVVVVSGRVDPHNIVYAVLSAEESPWPDFGAFGKVTERIEALARAESTRLFEFVDAISAGEHRLSSRILSSGLKG
jgi:hypothetical protein